LRHRARRLRQLTPRTRAPAHASPPTPPRARAQARLTPQERATSLARVLAAIASSSPPPSRRRAGAAADDARDEAAASPEREEDGVSLFLSHWHLGAPASSLRRVNMQRFLAAIFFFCELHELDAAQRAELDAMLTVVEAATGRAFPPGEAPAVRAMRVSMPSEPLRWVHFPLGVYAALRAVHAVTHAAMRAAGFRHCAAGKLRYYYRPPRPRAPHAPPPPPPVVLLPGIGIGVAGYLPMVLGPLAADGAALFVVELPHVAAGRLDGVMHEEEEVVASLLAMLRAHAHELCNGGGDGGGDGALPAARWVAHSYGSFVLSWLLRHEVAAARVCASLLLLDPVAVLIAFPHVLHGAVYRAPLAQPLASLADAAASDAAIASSSSFACRLRALARLTMSYVVTKEAHTALAVQRHTFWPSASIWLEDVPIACHVTLALSDGDVLLPVHEVARYAAAAAAVRRERGSGGGGEEVVGEIGVVWMEQHSHGEVAMNPTHWPRLADALAMPQRSARGAGAGAAGGVGTAAAPPGE
jgi:hypothetical protein